LHQHVISCEFSQAARKEAKHARQDALRARLRKLDRDQQKEQTTATDAVTANAVAMVSLAREFLGEDAVVEAGDLADRALSLLAGERVELAVEPTTAHNGNGSSHHSVSSPASQSLTGSITSSLSAADAFGESPVAGVSGAGECVCAAGALLVHATLHKGEGRYGRALAAVEWARAALISADASDSADSSDNHLPGELKAEGCELAGAALAKLGRLGAAASEYDAALSTARQLEWTGGRVARLYMSMGLVAKKDGNYQRALQAYTDAERLADEEDHGLLFEVTLARGDVLRKLGQLREARAAYEQVLPELEIRYGRRHELVGVACNALGMLAKKEGRYADARTFYNRALAILERLHGEEHPDVGVIHTSLGDVYRKLGDFPKAEEAYEHALPIIEASLGGTVRSPSPPCVLCMFGV
jgi:tetratricopeptide (TPR) repeat protein